MRKLIYLIATTLDGFIAKEDGSGEGFLTEGTHINDRLQQWPETFPPIFHNGAEVQNKQFDTVLIGRKTYETAVKHGLPNPYPSLEQYVFSSSMTQILDANVKVISEDVGKFVKQLKTQAGQDLWLSGSGGLATQLFAEGLIDKLIITVHPLLYCSGVPLLQAINKVVRLEPISSTTYPNGVLCLHYQVKL
jgi:dihydrofolate reductase